MATETVINRPAPFVEDIGKSLAEQTIAQQQVPVVTTGLAGLGTMAQPTQQAFETADQFKQRQDLFQAQQRAALGFEQRQQALTGLAPEVAKQDALQREAQRLAQAQAGTTGIAGFQPFLTEAQKQVGAAGTGLGAISLGAPSRQQIDQFMSPFQSQVIQATLNEFDRNKQIQEQQIRDQQAALGALGSGRAGVQLAEFGTGAARERALLQAGLLQQGFNQAMQARQQDIANRFGVSQGLQGLAAQQAALGQATTGIAGTNLARLGQLGALNQAQRQAELDATREAARQAAFLPQEQLGNFADIATGIMGGMRGTGTVATNVPNPTPLQTALGIGTTLAGAYLGRG